MRSFSRISSWQKKKSIRTFKDLTYYIQQVQYGQNKTRRMHDRVNTNQVVFTSWPRPDAAH